MTNRKASAHYEINLSQFCLQVNTSSLAVQYYKFAVITYSIYIRSMKDFSAQETIPLQRFC